MLLEAYASATEKYYVAVITKRDFAYSEAVDEAMGWWIVTWFVVQQYLELPELWGCSRNAQWHVERQESELTGMNKVQQLWAGQVQRGEAAGYIHIITAVARSRPWRVADSESHVAFLSKHSGGV